MPIGMTVVVNVLAIVVVAVVDMSIVVMVAALPLVEKVRSMHGHCLSSE